MFFCFWGHQNLNLLFNDTGKNSIPVFISNRYTVYGIRYTLEREKDIILKGRKQLSG